MWKAKKFVHEFSSIIWFSSGIRSLLKQTDTRWSADIIIYPIGRTSQLTHDN